MNGPPARRSIARAVLMCVPVLLSVPAAGLAGGHRTVAGRIAAVDAAARTVVIRGHRYRITPRTDYDDRLRGFADLRAGQWVELAFHERADVRYVDGVERDRPASTGHD